MVFLSVCLYLFQFVYIDRFSYVEPSLHLWDEADLVMVDNFLLRSRILFASILLSIFASEFMSEIAL